MKMNQDFWSSVHNNFILESSQPLAPAKRTKETEKKNKKKPTQRKELIVDYSTYAFSFPFALFLCHHSF